MSDLGTNAAETPKGYTFTKYVRVVLPLDGFVFWVRASSLARSSLFNAMKINGVPFNVAEQIAAKADTIEIKGSLHFATQLSQEEDETFATNTITFTAEKQVVELNAIDTDVLYMLVFRGQRYFFGATENFFQAANTWHYLGHAVYPDMATQVIDDPRMFYERQIVSNSLPIWLSFNNFEQQEWEPFNCPVRLFPAFLSPLNMVPPFATVNIDDTASIASGATYDRTWGATQLTKEKVRVTLWGLGNDASQDFSDFVMMWTTNNPNDMGIMNSPAVVDGKRTQVEIQTLAQKKTIDFEINYYQSRARDIARALIESVVVDYDFG